MNKIYMKKWYANNISKDRINKRRAYQRYAAKVTLLRNKPCFDCKGTFPPYVMEFDHRDPSTKKFTIGSSKFGRKDFKDELSKCDLVCANCHRIRTHKQRLSGFFRRNGFIDLESNRLANIQDQIEFKLEAI